VAGYECPVAHDADELERQHHAWRQQDRRWQLHPEFDEPILDLPHGGGR
jgi:hypothetical protein